MRRALVILAAVFAGGLLAAAPAALSPEGKKAHDEAVGKALDAFKKAMGEAKTDNDRAVAILALGQGERDLRIVAALAPHLAGDQELARAEAIAAVKVYRRERAACGALLAAVPGCKGKPTPLVKLLDALGAVGCDEAVPVLVDHLKDSNKQVAAAAAKALGGIPSAAGIEPMVKSLRRLESDRGSYQLPTGGISNDGQERFNAVAPPLKASLAAITGQTLSTAAEYEDWWKRSQGTFKAKAEEGGAWRCKEHH
jgi:hypothetical protein